MTDSIGLIYTEIETKLSYRVWSMMKIRKDNDMTNLTDTSYTKRENELSWPIRPSAICKKKQDRTTTWSIVQV